MNTDSRLLYRWVCLCAAAELLGIGSAAVWYGAVNIWVGEPSALALRLGAWLLMSLAAVPEGLILGGLQVIGLRWFFPATSRSRWILATTAVGLVGWGIGTAIPLFMIEPTGPEHGAEPSLAATAAFSAVFGVGIGAVFGLAQSWALPPQARPRRLWVACNAIGWALGLPLIYMAAQVAADQAGWTLRLLLWALGGVGAGASVGVATGLCLRRLKSGSG